MVGCLCVRPLHRPIPGTIFQSMVDMHSCRCTVVSRSLHFPGVSDPIPKISLEQQILSTIPTDERLTMSDTQPTKFCKDCKHSEKLDNIYLCNSNKRKRIVNLTSGDSYYEYGGADDVRKYECRGEWWEEKPKEYQQVFIPRHSIFQRIKNWLGR